MTLIIEKPKAEEERTTRTPGNPCRLTVNGYVIWSSISCGERPIQSVKTITWLSDKSGISSIGVVSKAQYPHPPNSKKPIITRNRLRSAASMSQWIMRAFPLLRATPAPAETHHGWALRRDHGTAARRRAARSSLRLADDTWRAACLADDAPALCLHACAQTTQHTRQTDVPRRMASQSSRDDKTLGGDAEGFRWGCGYGDHRGCRRRGRMHVDQVDRHGRIV